MTAQIRSRMWQSGRERTQQGAKGRPRRARSSKLRRPGRTISIVGLAVGLAAATAHAQSSRTRAKASANRSFLRVEDSAFDAHPAAAASLGVQLADPRALVDVALWLETRDLNVAFRLPASVFLVGRECGEANAYYDADRRVVTVCYELGAAFKAALADGSPPPVLSLHVIKALRFAIAHEVGHAMISILRLPTLGREEDAADQFALWDMAEMSDNSFDAATGIVSAFAIAMLKLSQGESELASAYDATHALGMQRAANVSCWLAGFGDSIGDAPNEIGETVSADRRRGCRAEYELLQSSWTRLLAPEIGGSVPLRSAAPRRH